jgi:hypothetical protein
VVVSQLKLATERSRRPQQLATTTTTTHYYCPPTQKSCLRPQKNAQWRMPAGRPQVGVGSRGLSNGHLEHHDWCRGPGGTAGDSGLQGVAPGEGGGSMGEVANQGAPRLGAASTQFLVGGTGSDSHTSTDKAQRVQMPPITLHYILHFQHVCVILQLWFRCTLAR